jgi:hypothetical protein
MSAAMGYANAEMNFRLVEDLAAAPLTVGLLDEQSIQKIAELHIPQAAAATSVESPALRAEMMRMTSPLRR